MKRTLVLEGVLVKIIGAPALVDFLPLAALVYRKLESDKGIRNRKGTHRDAGLQRAENKCGHGATEKARGYLDLLEVEPVAIDN